MAQLDQSELRLILSGLPKFGPGQNLNLFLNEVDRALKHLRPKLVLHPELNYAFSLHLRCNKIEGEARDYLACLNLDSWDQIRAALINRYGDQRSEHILRTNLGQLYQKQGESYLDFYQRIAEARNCLLQHVQLHCAGNDPALANFKATEYEDLALRSFKNGVLEPYRTHLNHFSITDLPSCLLKCQEYDNQIAEWHFVDFIRNGQRQTNQISQLLSQLPFQTTPTNPWRFPNNLPDYPSCFQNQSYIQQQNPFFNSYLPQQTPSFQNQVSVQQRQSFSDHQESPQRFQLVPTPRPYSQSQSFQCSNKLPTPEPMSIQTRSDRPNEISPADQPDEHTDAPDDFHYGHMTTGTDFYYNPENKPFPDINLNSISSCYQSKDVLNDKHIRTPDNTPVQVKSFRHPHPMKIKIQNQFQTLLVNEIIRPPISLYPAPVWLVPRKADASGKRKVSYRNLDKYTIENKYPLPRIDDILDNLGERSYFCKTFRPYLSGQQFLARLSEPYDPNSRPIRWRLKLGDYNFSTFL